MVGSARVDVNTAKAVFERPAPWRGPENRLQRRIAGVSGAYLKAHMASVDDVLARARAATGRSTLYWLGQGGMDPAAPGPSSRLAVGRVWPTLPRAQQLALEPLALAWGIDVHDRGLVMDACDCSGYVCWALGFSRHTRPAPFTDPGGWIFTDSIWHDARGPGVRFHAIDRARPGALVVYPKQGSGEDFGHVGLVMEADADGRATRVAHCAAVNAGSAPFDAIKITPPDLFEQQAASIYAWCREVV
jgi:hypothetical protein